MAKNSNALPQKESTLFKKILKQCEQKQYKLGLKNCQSILSKYPEHGETLAMKGLFHFYTGKKEDGYENVKKGLRFDLKSAVCWHVYGLLQQADKKYEDAAKAFVNALRYDEENVNILRDLSLLQMQTRQYDGFLKTRRKLLAHRPSPVNWVAYAVGFHVSGNPDMALKVLDAYDDCVGRQISGKNSDDSQTSEKSEMILYRFDLMVCLKQYEAANRFLQDNQSKVVDMVRLNECRADILVKLGRANEALEIYQALIKRNPESLQHIESFLELQVVKKQDYEQQLQVLFDEYPRSTTITCLILKKMTGSNVRNVLLVFIGKGLRKGMPPLFSLLKQSMYHDVEKVALVESIALDVLRSLKSVSRYPEDMSKALNDDDALESPTTTVWTYYLLAQHFCYRNRFDVALGYVDEAIAMAPTLVELYMIKAKIFKATGNTEEAVHWSHECQALDTADRYVNCYAAKMLFRNDKVPEADTMAGKFTREGQDPCEAMKDSQCYWFLTERAASHIRLGDLKNGLARCVEINKHFQDMTEDQFDFHNYCCRKVTLSSYLRMLNFEDHIFGQPYLAKAVEMACLSILFPIHDCPAVQEVCEALKQNDKKVQQEGLSKKMKKLMEKNAALDAEQAAAEAKAWRPSDPLSDAERMILPLVEFAPHESCSWRLSFELNERKHRPLMLCQAVRHLHELLGKDDAVAHFYTQRLLAYLRRFPVEDSDVKEAICQLLVDSFSSQNPFEVNAKALNADFLSNHLHDLSSRLSAAKCAALHDDRATSESIVADTLTLPITSSYETDNQLSSAPGLLDVTYKQTKAFFDECNGLLHPMMATKGVKDALDNLAVTPKSLCPYTPLVLMLSPALRADVSGWCAKHYPHSSYFNANVNDGREHLHEPPAAAALTNGNADDGVDADAVASKLEKIAVK